MRIAKISLAAAATLGMAAVIAGCGSPATTTSAPKAAPLVMAPGPYGSYTANFNPFSPSPNAGTDGFIYEPLFYFSTVSKNQYNLLGKSYHWSNNNKTLTVTLRSHVKWTNGSSFSAKDVVFTFNLLKSNPALDTSGVWQKLSSVASPNASTVVFTFKKADVPFAVYVLETYIVPQSIWSKVSDPAKYLNSQPVGTGPFSLSSFTSEEYKLKANPHYYLGKPKVPEVQFPAYDSNNALNTALAAGQLGWSGQFIPDIKSVYTSKSPHNQYWFTPYEVAALYPNLNNSLLALPVRQAINVALNRQAMGAKGEYGYEKPASPTGLILPAQNQYLAPGIPTTETYSPSKATAILSKAGYKKNASGVFVSPSGQPLNLTIQVPSGWSDWDADCAMAAQDLSAVGIKTTVVQDSFGEYMANLKGGKFTLAMSWTNPGPTPYYAFYNSLDPKGSWDLENYNNSTVNHALDRYASTTNQQTQIQAIQTVEQSLANQLPMIPLLDGALWDEYSTANYTGWPTPSNPYVTNAPYSWPAPEIVLMHLKPQS